MRLQPLARARAASLGEAGAAWVAGLPDLLAGLAADWGLALGRPVPGGSTGYVVRATVVGTGAPRVLKLVMPALHVGSGATASTREAAALEAAAGRGHALLHAHDEARGALLLEALGPSLEQVPTPVEEGLDLMARVLRTAHRGVPPGTAVPDVAAERAAYLSSLAARWERRPDVLDPAVRDHALACLARRSAALPAVVAAGRAVVGHGDAHPSNLLRVAQPREGAPDGWVWVDPGGGPADPAHDAGTLLRDGARHLEEAAARGEDPRALHDRWVALVAARLGLDEDAVRDWADGERVTTGLHVLGFGAEAVGRRFLRTAGLLLRGV